MTVRNELCVSGGPASCVEYARVRERLRTLLRERVDECALYVARARGWRASIVA